MKELYAISIAAVIGCAIAIGTSVTHERNIERGNPFHIYNSVYQCTKLYEVSSDKVQHKTNKFDALSSNKRGRKLPSYWDSRNLETM